MFDIDNISHCDNCCPRYPRVCHDLEPRSYLQGKDHNVHIEKIGVPAKIFHRKLGFGWSFTSHLKFAVFRFTLSHLNWSCTLLKISMHMHSVDLSDIDLNNSIHVVAGVICPIRTGLVLQRQRKKRTQKYSSCSSLNSYSSSITFFCNNIKLLRIYLYGFALVRRRDIEYRNGKSVK